MAVLHDRELDEETITALQKVEFPHNLGLLPTNPEVWQLMAEATKTLTHTSSSSSLIDEMAAAYAQVYITCALGASPCESAWLDKDHLLYQYPMFELRQLYKSAGLAAKNWRLRSEDHICMQLSFIAHIATRLAGDKFNNHNSWHNLANMLDEHILLWLPEFAQKLDSRGAHAFYVALAVTTVEWLDTLREHISSHLGDPRPSREEIKQRREQRTPQQVSHPITFVPGDNAPSW